MRVKVTLACTECKQRNYNTFKNKKNDPDRIEFQKYCSHRVPEILPLLPQAYPASGSQISGGNTMADNKVKKPKKERKSGRIKQFFKEVMGELKKLSWPSKKDMVSYTLTVIAFIAVMAIVIYVLDLAFSEGISLLAKL